MSTFGSSLWGGGGVTEGPSGAYSIADILYHALRKARVTEGPGRKPGPSQISDAFFLFKTLLDSWRAQRLTILNVSRTLFPLKAGQATYSIGPEEADFTTNTRPSKIEYAGLVYAANAAEVYLELYTLQRWATITFKNIQTPVPQGIFYEPTIPNGRITSYPVPNAADQLALYFWDTSADPGGATESLDLSPGFLKALIENLALDLCDTFGTVPTARLEREARDSKAAIQLVNLPPPPVAITDSPGSGRSNYNIYSNRHL